MKLEGVIDAEMAGEEQEAAAGGQAVDADCSEGEVVAERPADEKAVDIDTMREHQEGHPVMCALKTTYTQQSTTTQRQPQRSTKTKVRIKVPCIPGSTGCRRACGAIVLRVGGGPYQ